MSLIRQFAIFMNNLGYDAYVYPTKLIKLGNVFTPYIFTHEEISKIIKTSDNLKKCNCSPNYHLIYPVLIRLLYGCGLRISEALSLKVSDVNLQDGILTITKSKFNKSRLVPMSESLTRVLIDYAAKMNFFAKENGYFSPAPDKGRYNRTPVYLKFRHIVKEAGIMHPKDPRLHDLSYPNLNKIQTFCKKAAN